MGAEEEKWVQTKYDDGWYASQHWDDGWCAPQQCDVGITIPNNRWIGFVVSKKWAVRNKVVGKCN